MMQAKGLPESAYSVEKAQEYPNATHIKLTTATMNTVCIKILNIFFWRTKPP